MTFLKTKQSNIIIFAKNSTEAVEALKKIVLSFLKEEFSHRMLLCMGRLYQLARGGSSGKGLIRGEFMLYYDA